MSYNKKYKVPKVYKKDNKKYPTNIQMGNYYSPLLMDMMTLQQTIGNQEVQRMFKTGELLAKLFVNQPGDVYEQEADRVAQKIVNMENKEVQLKSEKTKIQKKGTYLGGDNVSSQTEAGINSLKGKGHPLEPKIRDYFQPRFGVDLGNVRVHTDSNADKLARAIRARAFTLGNDVVFAKGEYKPETHEGKKLVAHELTHVLQQESNYPDIINRSIIHVPDPDPDPPELPHCLCVLYSGIGDIYHIYCGRDDLHDHQYSQKEQIIFWPIDLLILELYNLIIKIKLVQLSVNQNMSYEQATAAFIENPDEYYKYCEIPPYRLGEITNLITRIRDRLNEISDYAGTKAHYYNIISMADTYSTQLSNMDIVPHDTTGTVFKGSYSVTCNLTSLSMALSALGKSPNNFSGNWQELIDCAIAYYPYLSELEDHCGPGDLFYEQKSFLTSLRFPDFLQLCASIIPYQEFNVERRIRWLDYLKNLAKDYFGITATGWLNYEDYTSYENYVEAIKNKTDEGKQIIAFQTINHFVRLQRITYRSTSNQNIKELTIIIDDPWTPGKNVNYTLNKAKTKGVFIPHILYLGL